MGQRVRSTGAKITVRGALPDGAAFVLLRGGAEVARASGPIEYTAEQPGAYRVEARVANAPGSPPVPWIVTNPIYVSPADAAREAPGQPEAPAEAVAEPGRSGWTVEKDPVSDAQVSPTSLGVSLSYRLRAGERVSQYVAAATTLTPPLPAFDAIVFTGRSAQPARISVQLRLPSGRRWTRSAYLAADSRRIEIPVSDLVPADDSSGPPDLTSATSLLFVVDLTNNLPGSAGEFTISDVMFVRR
jgi:hypothetical protein